MAEAMVSKSPLGGDKENNGPSLFKPGSFAQELEKNRMNSGKNKQNDKSVGNNSGSKSGNTVQQKPKLTTQKDISTESLKILQQLNDNVKKQGAELKALTESQRLLTERVDNLYETDDYDDYSYDNEYYDDADEENDDSCPPPFQSSAMSNDGDDDMPPTKKTKSSSASGLFKGLTERYHVTEKTDDSVDDDLADFVNNSFRHGVCDERLAEILKETHRPDNCSSLTKTRVNPGMWRLLKNHTQVADNKMQVIQNLVVKAGILIVKYLHNSGASTNQKIVEFGSNALALLGQANHLINNKRKESHKSDLDVKYAPLTSPNLPYTDWLYGDEQDINRNIKDIQDMSRIGKIARGVSSRSRGRGFRGFRGYGPYRRFGARGLRRFRGRGRAAYGYRQSQDDEDELPSYSKNPKSGQRK